MPRRPLVRNVLRLALAGLAGRAVDTLYRVSVARAVGPEAMGLVQMTAPLYGLAYSVATLALAPVLAKLTATETSAGPTATLRRAALPLGAVSGILGFVLLSVAARPLSTLVLTDPRTRSVLSILPFALLPAGLCAVQRGMLLGRQQVRRISYAQVVEPLTRTAAVFTVLALFAPRNAAGLAAALATGTVFGELAECLTLWVPKRLRWSLPTPPVERMDYPKAVRHLLGLATPLVSSQIVFSLSSALEAAVIPRRLALAGFSFHQTTRMYGQLYGMGLPLIFAPMLLVGPITAVLLPAIAEAQGRGDTARATSTTQKAGLAVGAVAAIATCLLVAMSTPLGALMRGGSDFPRLLRLLALWAPFAFADHFGSTVLIALGRNAAALTNGFAASCVRLVTSFILVAIPGVGIAGAVAGFIAGDALAVALHFRLIRRELRA